MGEHRRKADGRRVFSTEFKEVSGPANRNHSPQTWACCRYAWLLRIDTNQRR
jgi:hypothetical protein